MTDDPPAQPKLIDRIKNAVTGEKQPPLQPLPQPVMQPQQQQPQAPASTPFRGTGTNGAPVYAGPPAYRWYGWGTVTPGANPLAPAGQYPKASANWYNITGATPGAFPVPVGNPARVPSGTEPPDYGLASRQPAPAPVVTVSTPPAPQPSIQYIERPLPPPVMPPAESKFMPGSGIGAAPLTPPAPAYVPPAPAPVSVPILTPPPMPKPAAVAPLAPSMPNPDPVASLPPLPAPPVATLPPLPVPPVTPAPAVEPVKLPGAGDRARSPLGVPSPLPTSVDDESAA